MSGGNYDFIRQKVMQQTGVDPQSINPAVQPLAASTGNVNFDEFSDIVKTPLKGLLKVLDASGKYGTRPALGALGRAVTNPGPLGRALGVNLANAPFMGDRWKDPEFVAAMNQGSYTDSFNKMYEGRGFERFMAEAVADPLNLVGVGAIPAAARGIGLGAKGVRGATAVDDVLNAIQSAPITLPMKGIRKGLRSPVVSKYLEKSAKNQYSVGTRNYQNLLDELDRLGLPYDTNAEGNLIGLTPEIMTRAVESATDPDLLIKSADSSVLGRTFDQMVEQGNQNADLMAQELSSRGLMKQTNGVWEKSGKLRAHEQIDEVSDVMQHSEDERDAWKAVVDIAANRIWKSNRQAYKNIDDVYSTMNFRAMTDLPAETGDELFARLDRNSDKVQDVLSKLETKESIAELLGDPRVENAGIWNWYPRGAELLYNMGFDHSRAFTDEQAEWLFNQEGMQDVVTRLNMDPAQVLDRLKNISKIETVTQLIGAGSMNEGPTRNLYNSLNAYRHILEGRERPFEGFGAIVQAQPGKPRPTIRTPRTEDQRSAFDLAYLYGNKEAKGNAEAAFARGEEYVTQPGDIKVGGQAAKAYAGLAHPEGLLQDDYLRKAGLGKATFGGADTYIHDDVDKMHLFSEVLREETDAFAAYQAAIKNGATPQEAQAIRDDIRSQIKGYVSDIWDQRGTMNLEGRLTDDLIEKGIPESYKKLATRPTTAGGWFALKSFVHEDLFPYLTGRMPGGGEVPAGMDVHPDAAFFRSRYVNPAALQADLWARFRFRDKNAVEPALKMLSGNPEEVQRILAEEGPDGVRKAFGNLVFDIQETPEYGRGLKEFTDDSQDFLANASSESNTFSNKEAVSRLAPQIRTGEGFQTAAGDVLPYAPEEVVEAMINGDYKPLMQMMGEDIKQGMFQMGENGPVVSFFPRAGMSTPIHEIFGHTMRAQAGPDAQRAIRRGLGEPVYADDAANAARMSTSAEEEFAEQAEGLVRGGQAGSVDEAAEFGRMRRLSDLEYMRQQGVEVPDEDIMNLMGTRADETRSFRGQREPGSVDYRVMNRAREGRATAQDVRRIARSGEYGVVSARTTEALDDPSLAQRMNILEDRVRDMGYEPYRAEGMYGGEAEPSLFIPGLSREDAITLGKEFGQESVMLGREGQVFSDGSQTIRSIGDVTFDESDNFTRVMTADGKEVTFSQPLDFPDDAGQTVIGQAGQQAYENTTLSAPRADAPVREVLDQIALESGFSTDDAVRVSNTVEREIAPIFEKNPQLNTVSMWSHPNVRQHIEAAMRAGDETQMRQAVSDAIYEVDGLWSSLGYLHPYLSKVRHLLPKDLRKSVQVESRAYGRRATGSRLSEEQLTTLREANAMEAVNKVQKNYNDNLRSVSQIVDEIAQAHPVITPVSDLTTYRDLRRVYEYANPKQKKVLDGFFKTFDIPDMTPDEAMKLTVRQAHRKDLIITHQKALAKQLGIDYDKTPDGLRALAQKVGRGWREQALLSVRYHFANGMDMVAKSAIYGVNPLVPPGSATRQMELWGRSMPRGVRVESVSRGQLGALPAEFADEAEESLLPGPIGKLSKKSRSLARGMENVVREAAFKHGAVENMQRNMPAFEAAARREAGAAADGLLDDLRKSLHGVSMTSEQIAQTVIANGGDAAAASRLATIWDRQLDDAFREGADLSNLVHFDFGDERVIEEKLKLRHWAPFHFWATRNIPFYLDTLATHPTIMRKWQDYSQAAEREEQEEGLPARLKSMVPLPGPADKFLDTLFGPGRSYFNPMVVISIADQAKPRFEDQDQPLIGRTLDKLQAVGLAPAPWFSYPLSILGVYGPDDEQMPVLRHSSMLKNATGLMGIDPTGTGGVDVEQPLRFATNQLREKWTGKKVQTISGSAYKDYQISKRLAEMSIELTGYANHPEILSAMRDPNHPLYKEAEKRVQKDNLLSDVQHFVTPIPHKRLPETEELIRDRQGVMPEGAMADRDFRDNLVSRGDPAGAYLRTPKPKVLEPVMQDQYGNVQGQSSGQSGGGQQRDTTNWGGDVWGPDKPAPFNNPIIMNFYLKRIGSRGYISPEEYVQSISV